MFQLEMASEECSREWGGSKAGPIILAGSNRIMTDHTYGPEDAASCRDAGRNVVGRGRSLMALAAAALMLGGCVVEVPATGSTAAPGYGYTCYAGVYVCRTPQQVPVGSPCSCPGIGAPSFGRVH